MSNDVRKRSPRIEAIAGCWPMITALLGGTASMRAAGKEWLPQWPNEDGGYYEARRKTATLFPAFSRTVEVLSGKPFSRPVTWDADIPERVSETFDDIDLEGTNLHSFLANVCEEALAYGLSGILVDYPRVSGKMNLAQEKAAGLRPYFVKISPTMLLDYKSKRIQGRETITHLRFVEYVQKSDPENEFSEETIEQVRVLDIGRWRIYQERQEETTGEKKWVLVEEGKTSLKKIPFVPVYGNKTGFMLATPPLAELAFMNVEHWQTKSDQQTILHVARVPILFGRQLGDAPITVGAASVISTDTPEGDLKYVEHTGKAIEAGRMDILDLEDKMRQIGAELLVIKPGRNTVAQTMADDESGTCALQRIVGDLQDAASQAIALLAEWLGDKQCGHITIFRDFGAATLAEASAELLMEMNIAGSLSNETLFREIQRRGMISPEIKWEEEQKRIATQPAKPGTTELNA
ncbi:DUF4055 domain-containing protein [Enterobacter ludwigii]|uniref:DUF4055 domain-containing protein n=1 Tax=Enterobacter ludwigii TaxID=299767 RepID=UPI003F705301